MAIRKIVSRSISDNAITNSDLATAVTTNPVFSGTDSLIAPKGTTAQRNGTPVEGMLRYNTSIGLYEQYTALGWQAIDAPPTVTNISGTINENTTSTITVTGTNFKSGSTVYIEGAAVGGIPRAMVTTYVSSTQLTFSTNASSVNFTGNASFDVKVTNTSGLSGSLVAAGTVDRDPIWSTAAGTIATINDAYGSYFPIATVSASDPDGSSVTYSVTSGSLPAGTTLNASTGAISGDPDNVLTSTTSTFTITATSNTQEVPRSFSIVVNPALDGSTSGRAATSASSIKSITGTTTNGLYWITVNGTAKQIYCDMNTDGGGWMLTYRVDGNGGSSCSSGVWDFHTALAAGDSTSPQDRYTVPTNGSGIGFDTTWRGYLWNSCSCSQIRAESGTGSSTTIDWKLNNNLSDSSNMVAYAAKGNLISPSTGYSNAQVGSNVATIISSSTGFTVGSSYGLYSLGHYTCNCCESYHVSNTGTSPWEAGSPSVMIFGDGPRNGSVVVCDWCNFWVK